MTVSVQDPAISPGYLTRGSASPLRGRRYPILGSHPVWVIFLFGLMVLASLLLLVLATIKPLSVSGNDSSIVVPDRLVVTRSV